MVGSFAICFTFGAYESLAWKKKKKTPNIAVSIYVCEIQKESVCFDKICL